MWFTHPVYSQTVSAPEPKDPQLPCSTCKQELADLLPKGIDRGFKVYCSIRCMPTGPLENIREPSRIAGHHDQRFRFK